MDADTFGTVCATVAGLVSFTGVTAFTYQLGKRAGVREERGKALPVDNPCGCGHPLSYHTDLRGRCHFVVKRAVSEVHNHKCTCRGYAQAPMDASALFPSM